MSYEFPIENFYSHDKETLELYLPKDADDKGGKVAVHCSDGLSRVRPYFSGITSFWS